MYRVLVHTLSPATAMTVARTPIRRLLLACTIALVALAAAAQQLHAQTDSATISRRDANRLLDEAVLKMRNFYGWAGTRRKPLVTGDCSEIEGDDCFGGDRECRHCPPWEPGQPIRQLALFYDSAGHLLRTPPPGLDPEKLDWLAGQRVGMWVRLRQPARARVAAEECVASDWWCEALRAWVDHISGDPVAAEGGFRRAISLMPADQACYWTEVTLYGDSPGSSVRYHGGRGHCRPIEEYDSFWVLADPLFSQPGNERMTEHYARHVDMRVHEQYLDKMSGNHPLTHHMQLLLRSWHTGYLRASETQVIATYVPGSGQGFIVTLPVAEALLAPQHVFVPLADDATEIYRAPVGTVAALPLQTGFFRRGGESVLLVRATAPPVRTRSDWQLLSWNGTGWRDASVQRSGAALTAWLRTPWEPQIVSVEALVADGAFRARTGNVPPSSSGTVALSSIVFLDGADAAPTSLEEASRLMRPQITVDADDRIAAYWELYIPQPQRATMELTTTPLAQPGLFARLLRRTPAVRTVRWSEEVEPASGVVRRALGLDAHSLAPGAYEIALRVELEDGSTVRSAARLEVVGTPGP